MRLRAAPELRFPIQCRGRNDTLSTLNAQDSPHFLEVEIHRFQLNITRLAYNPTDTTMAKKPATQSTAAKTPSVGAAKPPPPAARPSSSSASAPPPRQAAPNTLSPRSSPQDIAFHVWNRYLQDTPSRTILLDVFLAFIALNGAVQFVYCILAGNYVQLSILPHLLAANMSSSLSMRSSLASVPALANSSSPSHSECRPLSVHLLELHQQQRGALSRLWMVLLERLLKRVPPRSAQKEHLQISYLGA